MQSSAGKLAYFLNSIPPLLILNYMGGGKGVGGGPASLKKTFFQNKF